VDLISAIQSTTLLAKYMRDDLPRELASCDLRAAANAIKNISSAKDQKSVYWSAINHLESAESKLEPKNGKYDHFQNAHNLIYLASIRAAIYKFLDEPGLINTAGRKCVDIAKSHNESQTTASTQGKNVVRAWNPFNWFGSSGFIGSARTFDYQRFWSILGHSVQKIVILDPDPRD
jgi:hypothetical protein